jgi:hypothetical protein
MTPTEIPLLKFNEAERLGGELHARWNLMTGGDAPLEADDPAWADIVQFIIRRASVVVRERVDATEHNGFPA